MKLSFFTGSVVLAMTLIACDAKQNYESTEALPTPPLATFDDDKLNDRFEIYASTTLDASLEGLSENQKQMVSLLIDASKIMDSLFWRQSFGDPQPLLSAIKDPAKRRFADINYGPWDRLNNNEVFVEGYDPKPLGAQFYPADMSKEEFEKWDEPNKKDLYSMVRRDDQGNLTLIKYSEYFKDELTQAAALVNQAAVLAEDPKFAEYLKLRAQAFLNDDYQPSDMAWMDVKNNAIDVVIGPIENYEDRLFNYRAAFESYVLIKDKAWSEKLSRFTQFLPALQKNLPVDEKYKQEAPGTDSDLNAYDVVYYAGDCNAGSKTIAINLPNDEEVQLKKGTRRLQLKNAMRAKFDKILVPLADLLIAEDQRQHITFDAFFANTMFHEVAHGLGIKNTINGSGSVRQALKETSSPIEEGKADILGLYMVTELFKQGEIKEGEVMDNYVTFMAGILRSVRFGAASAHGQANMVRFNFFEERGAFSRDDKTQTYSVDAEKMQAAMAELSQKILVLQGNGDYAAAIKLLADYGTMDETLQSDLNRLSSEGVPVDVSFAQGKSVLGLEVLPL